MAEVERLADAVAGARSEAVAAPVQFLFEHGRDLSLGSDLALLHQAQSIDRVTRQVIADAGFVGCHQFQFVDRFEMLALARPGATFLLNAPYGPDDLWDHLPVEDLGFVRRFLAGASGWSVLLVGEDAGHRAARAALSLPRVRWLPWPPDLAQLDDIVAAPDDLDEAALAELVTRDQMIGVAR